jgi:hypothetical protein
MDDDRIVDWILIGGYLTIIILRIFNVIDWGWKWILIPFWLPLQLSIAGLILALIIGIPWKIYLNIKEKYCK